MFITGTMLVAGTLISLATVYRRNKQKTTKLIIKSQSDLRTQQLQEFNSRVSDTSEAKLEADHQLTISSIALILSGGGALFFSPLQIASIPVILLALKQYVIRANQAIFKDDKKIGIAAIDLLGTAGPFLMGYYFVASLAIHLSNFSRKLLLKTEDHSQKSLTTVFALKPNFVWVQRGEVEVKIPFNTLAIGDIVVVNAGQVIPIDGTVTDGIAYVDQRALTGESQPVEKTIGASVFDSTIVLEGNISIRVEKAGEDTVATQIGEILNHTADFKSQVKSRGQKIVEQGATPTLWLSIFSLPFLGPERAIAILNSAFGYHMRHAAPIAVLNYLRIASENGVLIKDGRSLELLSQVDTFVFDKTGTLTEEIPTVGQIVICGEMSENELLTYVAAAEYKQTHPIALAILQEAKNRALILPPIEAAKYEVGYGLKVEINHKLLHIGSSRFLAMEEISIPSNYAKSYAEKEHSILYIAIDNRLAGTIELMPTIRSEVKPIISELKKRQMATYIISGDHEKPTQKLAQEVGIDHYFAETLPQNKAQLIEKLQNEGRSVCFVGDGINDAIALKKANVSVSLRGASTAATDSAAIIFMDSSLNQLIPLLNLATSLDANLKRGTVMTILPGVICVSGVLFLHFGIIASIILYYSSLAGSILNAFQPLIKLPKTGRARQPSLIQDITITTCCHKKFNRELNNLT
jgi:heavy metal translocating P-type ATPase